MQILITHGSLARTRVLRIGRLQLLLGAALVALAIVLGSGLIYHHIFVQAIRQGWPLVGDVAQLVTRDESVQRDRYLRENLDAMAQKVGELQAKLVRLEAVGERMAGAAGVKSEELRPLRRPAGAASSAGQGGPYLPVASLALALPRDMQGLQGHVELLDLLSDQQGDIFTLVGSRLFEARLAALLVPSVVPVEGPVGSGFGFRSDPITGRTALHTGLDFPTDIGTPIHAAAGGVVSAVDWHPGYGHVLTLDHGRTLSTLYAHASKIHVKVGDLVKRGQHVADVGNSGRSTGPHLHFEVLVDGVPQDPVRFLASAGAAPMAAQKPSERRR